MPIRQRGKLQICDVGSRHAAAPFDPIRIPIDPSEIDSANYEISEICLTHANCKFIQPMGRTISPEMLSDGLHLKADGIRALAARLREQLR
jgi:hypothetical protein